MYSKFIAFQWTTIYFHKVVLFCSITITYQGKIIFLSFQDFTLTKNTSWRGGILSTLALRPYSLIYTTLSLHFLHVFIFLRAAKLMQSRIKLPSSDSNYVISAGRYYMAICRDNPNTLLHKRKLKIMSYLHRTII